MAAPTAPLLTIDEVSGLDRSAFVAAFGEVLEASPHLAVAAWQERPFADRHALAAAFGTAVDALDEQGALALLRAHPVLGATGPMARASTEEQAGAGFRDLDEELRARIAADNARYQERFGFPFIIAVRGLTTAEVAAALAARLGNGVDLELATALEQVRRIAALRLEALVAP